MSLKIANVWPCSMDRLARGYVDEYLGEDSGLELGAVCPERLDRGIHALHDDGESVGEHGRISGSRVGSCPVSAADQGSA